MCSVQRLNSFNELNFNLVVNLNIQCSENQKILEYQDDFQAQVMTFK